MVGRSLGHSRPLPDGLQCWEGSVCPPLSPNGYPEWSRLSSSGQVLASPTLSPNGYPEWDQLRRRRWDRDRVVVTARVSCSRSFGKLVCGHRTIVLVELSYLQESLWQTAQLHQCRFAHQTITPIQDVYQCVYSPLLSIVPGGTRDLGQDQAQILGL